MCLAWVKNEPSVAIELTLPDIFHISDSISLYHTHPHTHTHIHPHTHTRTHSPSRPHRLGTLPGTRVPPMSLSLSATITRSSSGTRQPVHQPLRWMGCTLTSSTPSLGATTAAILPPPVKTRRSGSSTHASRRLSR